MQTVAPTRTVDTPVAAHSTTAAVNIVITQCAHYLHVAVTAELLDSQRVLSAIDSLRSALAHCRRSAALVEFSATRQRLQLWEIPGRWSSVFTGFPPSFRIAYVMSGKAFEGNSDCSSYFNHSGEVNARVFYNGRNAKEWLLDGAVSGTSVALLHPENAMRVASSNLNFAPVSRVANRFANIHRP